MLSYMLNKQYPRWNRSFSLAAALSVTEIINFDHTLFTCLKAHVHWQSLYANLPCLGHLGLHEKNEKDPIFVALPKVANASSHVTKHD